MDLLMSFGSFCSNHKILATGIFFIIFYAADQMVKKIRESWEERE